MLALAFGFGIWIASKRAPKRGVPSNSIVDIAVASLLFGLGGGRIAYVITHWKEFEGRMLDIISPIQSDGTIGIAGLVLLGGVVAGFGGAYWMSKKRGTSFLNVTDIMVPSLALGIAFGRLGCFMNGCCFGNVCDLPWSVVFPDSSLAGSVYPGISTFIRHSSTKHLRCWCCSWFYCWARQDSAARRRLDRLFSGALRHLALFCRRSPLV